MKAKRIAILGATGAVGTEMLNVLRERNFPVASLKLLADSNDAGKKITWCGQEYVVEEAGPDSFADTDITLVAVGNDVSLRFSPEAVKCGSVVVDNSSAYRMDPLVPLVIPEINPEDVRRHRGIIANPNCSTIIALTAVGPLHKRANIRRMVVSTYQAVSGAGLIGGEELTAQSLHWIRREEFTPAVFQHQIAFNLIPHIDAFEENGYTFEEMKMLREGRKILHAEGLQVSCTCVRVPVYRSHSEAITLELEQSLSPAEAREILSGAPGVRVVDDPARGEYPMPINTSGQDLVFVGRIRKDFTTPNTLSLWVCGDQVRKGAATNAVQIAELLASD